MSAVAQYEPTITPQITDGMVYKLEVSCGGVIAIIQLAEPLFRETDFSKINRCLLKDSFVENVYQNLFRKGQAQSLGEYGFEVVRRDQLGVADKCVLGIARNCYATDGIPGLLVFCAETARELEKNCRKRS